MAESTPSIRANALPLAVGLAIAYYWAYLYLRVALPETGESALAYVLTVAPVALLAALGAVVALTTRRADATARRRLGWLLAFVATAVTVSLARGDRATLLSAGLIGLALIWLVLARPRIDTPMLNLLFLLSLVLGAAMHAIDVSPYGVLPGQYAEGGDRGIEWRVSMYPFVPESGFFALIVLLANRLHGRGAARWLWMLGAFYMLVFSGVRSALLAWVLAEAYIAVHHRTLPTQGGRRGAAVGVLLLVFIVGVAGSSVLLLIPGLADSPLSSWLFREAAADLSDESVEQSVYRLWLWARHIDIFLASPLVGAGSYDFGTLVGSMVEGATDTGSESFLTMWLSRLGLCFLPFVALLASLLAGAVKRDSALPACMFIVLMVAALAYGSFLVPYNLLFILLFAMLLGEAPYRPRRSPRRSLPAAPTLSLRTPT